MGGQDDGGQDNNYRMGSKKVIFGSINQKRLLGIKTSTPDAKTHLHWWSVNNGCSQKEVAKIRFCPECERRVAWCLIYGSKIGADAESSGPDYKVTLGQRTCSMEQSASCSQHRFEDPLSDSCYGLQGRFLIC